MQRSEIRGNRATKPRIGLRFHPGYSAIINHIMTLRRFSSRSNRLHQSFLAEQLQGATSYRRIASYFTSSLFEVAHEWLDAIPDVKIVCNVDVYPDDLKVAQCLEAKMPGRWHANALEAEALLNRDRFESMPDKNGINPSSGFSVSF